MKISKHAFGDKSTNIWGPLKKPSQRMKKITTRKTFSWKEEKSGNKTTIGRPPDEGKEDGGSRFSTIEDLLGCAVSGGRILKSSWSAKN